MTSQSAVALVGQDDEASRHLPAMTPLPSGQRLSLALPSLDDLIVLERYGKMFAESGLFPKVQTWQAAAAIIQYGAQLGIDAFTALKDIYWIEGKPTCDASLINSLIKRDHGDDAIMPVVADRTVCTIRFKRRGWDHHEEATVRFEDYAHLHGKTNWKTSPADMLWARNISQIGRRHFSDTIKGLYTRDEMLDATEASYRVVEAPAVRTATVTAAVESVPVEAAAEDVAEAMPAPCSHDQARAIRRLATSKKLSTDDLETLVGGELWAEVLTFDEAAQWIAYLGKATAESLRDELDKAKTEVAP